MTSSTSNTDELNSVLSRLEKSFKYLEEIKASTDGCENALEQALSLVEWIEESESPCDSMVIKLHALVRTYINKPLPVVILEEVHRCKDAVNDIVKECHNISSSSKAFHQNMDGKFNLAADFVKIEKELMTVPGVEAVVVPQDDQFKNNLPECVKTEEKSENLLQPPPAPIQSNYSRTEYDRDEDVLLSALVQSLDYLLDIKTSSNKYTTNVDTATTQLEWIAEKESPCDSMLQILHAFAETYIDKPLPQVILKEVKRCVEMVRQINSGFTEIRTLSETINRNLSEKFHCTLGFVELEKEFIIITSNQNDLVREEHERNEIAHNSSRDQSCIGSQPSMEKTNNDDHVQEDHVQHNAVTEKRKLAAEDQTGPPRKRQREE